MFLMKCLLFLLLENGVISIPQLNLYYTDGMNENILEHDCLLVDASDRYDHVDQKMLFYCLSEYPMTIDYSVEKFSFTELSKVNITSEDLYHWSAPIDLIEDYELYLHGKSKSDEKYYNKCTLPRFGPKCEYEFDLNLSLEEIVDQMYNEYPYDPDSLTCYEHLQCTRGHSEACLDWSEICDGRIDCLNDGIDEKDCWKVEMNECNDDEYRCENGQCIPEKFSSDGYLTADCIDRSDQLGPVLSYSRSCYRYDQPSSTCEDIRCKDSPWTSSCVTQRSQLLMKIMFTSNRTDQCWLAFNSLMDLSSDEEKYVQWKEFSSEFNEKCFPLSEFNRNIRLIIDEISLKLRSYDLTYNYSIEMCNQTSMYQCQHSLKCISIFRCFNGIFDCPYKDDEDSNIQWMKGFNKTHFRCEISNKILVRSRIEDKNCDCLTPDQSWCEDEDLDIDYLRKNILFQHICDGFNDLFPIIINGEAHTDETECDNIYTHHNQVWNCPNGMDEIGFGRLSELNEHYCVSMKRQELICLSIEKINDGNVDCIGGTDEWNFCGKKRQFKYEKEFYCRVKNSSSCIFTNDLCDQIRDCDQDDDELFCQRNRTVPIYRTQNFLHRSPIEQFLCNYRTPTRQWKIIHFTFPQMTKSITKHQPSSSLMKISNRNRCLPIRIWFNKTEWKNSCLCPLNSYGNQCEYQNERISLAIEFETYSQSWRTIFTIVVLLIDDSNERMIHSFEQFTYLSVRDCQTKFNVWKSTEKYLENLFDFYERDLFRYGGSVLFRFLSVHRLGFLVNIPKPMERCSDLQCNHGKCLRYSNNKSLSFCQCHSEWSGRFCTRKSSFDSLCIGISTKNRSICLCPMNKFGPRCLLPQIINTKISNFTCERIAKEASLIPTNEFLCLCPKGFNGDH